MKKALAILAALALVASAASAEITVGGWGRIKVTPAMGSTASGSTVDAKADIGFADGARVGINFAGNSDNLGFNLNIDNNGPNLALGDQAKIWVKPNDMFKIELGRIQGDVLRGKFGDFGCFGYSAGGEDDIFTRFYPKAGMLLNVTPIEGLYIGIALDTGEYKKTVLTETMFKNIQAGVGYTIANVGLVRAQFIGNATTDATGKIEVAFNLTAIQNMNLDIGGKIDLAKADAKHSVAAGFSFNADALAITVRAKSNIATKVGLGVAAKIDYTIASPVTVGITAGYENEDDVSAAGGKIHAEPYVKLGYSNGYFAAGVSIDNDGTDTSWAIPLFAEYYF